MMRQRLCKQKGLCEAVVSRIRLGPRRRARGRMKHPDSAVRHRSDYAPRGRADSSGGSSQFVKFEWAHSGPSVTSFLRGTTMVYSARRTGWR